MRLFKNLLLVIFLICYFGINTFASEPLISFKNNIDTNNISKAIEIYDSLCIREKDEALKYIKEDIYILKERILMDDIDLTEAKLKVENYSTINEINKDIKKINREIDYLNESKMSFKYAKAQESKNNYSIALKSYLKVKQEDEKNYKISCEKINEIKNMLENKRNPSKSIN